jgi:putative ABC transport system permease protein
MKRILFKLKRRVRALFRKSEQERELDAELRIHHEKEVEQNLARGMNQEEARLAALRSFGGVEQVKEESRDVRGVRFIEELLQDLRYSLRVLRRQPGFTLTVVITLALGIGANTAIFSVVNAVLLRALPLKHPEEVMWVWSTRTDRDKAPFTLPDFLDYRDQNQTLEQIAAFCNIGLNLTGNEKTERLQAMRVSANLFELLGVDASAGRLLVAEDDDPARRPTAVLSYESWQKRFGGDPQVVGKTLNLDGESYTVVGVLPRNFNLPDRDAELAIPLRPLLDPLRELRSSTNFLRAVARLKPGVTRPQAESDLTSIVARQRQQFGDPYLKKTGVRLVSIYEETVGNVRTALWVLLGAVSMVLLIACSNLAALSLARASARHHEMSIRKALGATSVRLVRQLLAENLLLTLLGGAAGFLLATWGVRLLLALSPTRLPRDNEIGVDLSVLVFAAGASALAAVVFGMLPALLASRSEMRRGLLGGTSRGVGEGASRNRSSSILVVAEVSLSFILLIGAGLLIRSFISTQAVDPGFESANTLAVRLSLPKTNYHNRAAVSLFYDQLSSRLQALPGVESVGAISLLPMSPGLRVIPFIPKGQGASKGDSFVAQYRLVSPDYFRVMRIPLRQGRAFDSHDKDDRAPVAIVNETLASRFFPKGDAIGAQIQIDDNNTGPRHVEIVGVVGDVKHVSLEDKPTIDIYLPMAQVHEDGVSALTNSMYWVLRSNADTAALEPAIRRELRTVDPAIASADLRTLESYLAESVAPRRFNLRLLTIFSVAALLLAATGIYGLISYSVAQRTPELGIRLALGASRKNIFRIVLGQGLRLVIVGLVLGLIGALALTRMIRSLMFGVTATDPITFVAVSSLLIVITIAAGGLPALRATKLDPLRALRE